MKAITSKISVSLIWKIFQYISFQLIWLTAVVGGNAWLWLVLVLIALHLYFSPTRMADIKLLPLALIGIAADTGLTLVGVFEFSSPPLWLAAIWFGFVLNFGHSLSFLARLPRITLAPIGAAAGVWCYLAAWKLEAVVLPFAMWQTIVIIAVVWAMILPLLIVLDSHYREGSLSRQPQNP